MLESSGGHPETNAALSEIWSTIRKLEIKNERDSAAFSNVIEQLAEHGDYHEPLSVPEPREFE